MWVHATPERATSFAMAGHRWCWATLVVVTACATSEQGLSPGTNPFDAGLGGFAGQQQDSGPDVSDEAASGGMAGAGGALNDAGSDAASDASQDAAVDALPDAPPDVVSVTGLEGYWTFDEAAGLAFDISGNNNHGTVKGTAVAQAVAGKVGPAIGFNGGNGQVQIPNSLTLDFSTGATIEFWIRLGSVQSGTILSRGTGQNDSHVRLKTAQGNIQASFGQVGVGAAIITSSANVLSPGSWTHVAVVDDGSSLILYVDGTLHATASGGYLTAIFGDLYIGKSAAVDTAFNGSIDDLKWWNVTRSNQEICSDAGGTWALVDGAGACTLP